MFHKGLRTAIRVAQLHDEDEPWQLGAVIIKGGNILSMGINKRKNDPNIVEWEHCSIHAEVNAIRQAKNTSGAVIYVARLTKGGNIGLARPCNRCWESIIDAGIKKVFWTINNTKFGVERVLTGQFSQ